MTPDKHIRFRSLLDYYFENVLTRTLYVNSKEMLMWW